MRISLPVYKNICFPGTQEGLADYGSRHSALLCAARAATIFDTHGVSTE